MLSPHIVNALLVAREAELRDRAELARRRHPEPAPEDAGAVVRRRRAARPSRRRRHLRLV